MNMPENIDFSNITDVINRSIDYIRDNLWKWLAWPLDRLAEIDNKILFTIYALMIVYSIWFGRHLWLNRHAIQIRDRN